MRTKNIFTGVFATVHLTGISSPNAVRWRWFIRLGQLTARSADTASGAGRD